MSQSRIATQPITIAVSAVLALAVLACSIDVGGPEPHAAPITVSKEAASTLDIMWNSAVASAREGEITLLLNEQQLTSILAIALESAETPIVNDPQIYLHDGLIQFYGSTQQGPILGSFRASIMPRVDPSGAITFELASAEFGPFPAPLGIRSSVSAIITEAFTGTLGTLATGIRITTIAIDGGEMAIVGTLR